jgi:serine/threonine-protein kinase
VFARRRRARYHEEVKPGAVLCERFEIVRALARGGMADLFVATDRESGTSVAIKVLRENLSKNPEAIARFHREAAIASRLVSPHVAKVLHFGVSPEDWPYIVMELLQGKDLGKELEARAPLPYPEAASYIAQACRALIEAHDVGIVHRDLKPSNLFLVAGNDERALKVLDFGIAKLAPKSTEELTRATSIFGSPVYMSPEAFRSAKAADARSDIWSLGVILYEMLAGVTPFQGPDPLSVGLAVTREELPPLSRHVQGLPASLQAVVTRALMKDPAARFQTMRELLTAIEPFIPRARLDTPTREHVALTSTRPRAPESVEGDTHATLLKLPSIAPAPERQSSVPPRLAASESMAPAVMAAPMSAQSISARASPSTPPGLSRGTIAKLSLIAAVLGVTALAGVVVLVAVPEETSKPASRPSAPGSEAPSDPDQTPSASSPPATALALPSAAAVPVEDLPPATSASATPKKKTKGRPTPDPIPDPHAPKRYEPPGI